MVAFTDHQLGEVRIGDHRALAVHDRQLGVGSLAQVAHLAAQIVHRSVHADHCRAVDAAVGQGQADLASGEEDVGLGEYGLARRTRLRVPGALSRVVLVIRPLLYTQQPQLAVVETPLAEQPALAVERLALYQVLGRVGCLECTAHLGYAQGADQQELAIRVTDVHRAQGAVGTQVLHQHRQAIEARRQVVRL